MTNVDVEIEEALAHKTALDTLADLEEETLKPGQLGGLQVQTVQEQTPFINMLIYGDSGVGKTLLAGSAQDVPEMTPVLFLDVEGGTLTLRDKYPNIHVIRIAEWIDVQRVYDELYKGNTPYKTIVIDSLSEIQKFSMSRIMKATKAADSSRDEEVPGMREWGKNLWQIRSVVRGFRDLPMNCIFTSLARHDRDPRDGLTKSTLALQGQSAGEVPGHVDIVLYMYMKFVGEENKRILLTKKTEKEMAKDRTDRLPMIIEYPTMQLLHDSIFRKDE